MEYMPRKKRHFLVLAFAHRDPYFDALGTVFFTVDGGILNLDYGANKHAA